MKSRSSSRFSKMTSSLPLESIEESLTNQNHQVNISKSLDHSYTKAENIINKLIDNGQSIKETEGLCSNHYKDIKEGKKIFISNL